jgi:hypothetical protein
MLTVYDKILWKLLVNCQDEESCAPTVFAGLSAMRLLSRRPCEANYNESFIFRYQGTSLGNWRGFVLRPEIGKLSLLILKKLWQIRAELVST